MTSLLWLINLLAFPSALYYTGRCFQLGNGVGFTVGLILALSNAWFAFKFTPDWVRK